MTTIGQKRRYVKKAKQTRDHPCHWPGCTQQVPPARWGCSGHWFRLPIDLRRLIWKTYQLGQEITLTPSKAYIEAANKVQDWIREHGGEC